MIISSPSTSSIDCHLVLTRTCEYCFLYGSVVFLLAFRTQSHKLPCTSKNCRPLAIRFCTILDKEGMSSLRAASHNLPRLAPPDEALTIFELWVQYSVHLSSHYCCLNKTLLLVMLTFPTMPHHLHHHLLSPPIESSL